MPRGATDAINAVGVQSSTQLPFRPKKPADPRAAKGLSYMMTQRRGEIIRIESLAGTQKHGGSPNKQFTVVKPASKRTCAQACQRDHPRRPRVLYKQHESIGRCLFDGGDESFRTCRPTVGFRLFPGVQPDEVQD